MEKIYHARTNQKGVEIATLTLEKLHIKAKKKMTRDKRGTLDNNKSINLPRKHSNFKWICTKQQSCKVCKAKTVTTKRRNRQVHNDSVEFNTHWTTRQKINKDVK